MKKLPPWEFDVSTTTVGACKPFGISSFRVRVLDTTYPYYFESEMKEEI
jgi:hypothetical protein